MPRTSSESGFYHAILQGNARMVIFEDECDYKRMIAILRRYRDEIGFRVIAWCAMSTHVHLVIDVGDKELSPILQKVGIAYAKYHNLRTGRVGHVLQSFDSVPIETDAQLLATVAYVHANPEKAGVCAISDYRWSSYREYVGDAWLTDTTLILGMLGGADGFLRYRGSDEDVARIVRPARRRRMSDDEALAIVRATLGAQGIDILRSSDKRRRDAAFRLLHGLNVPMTQLARITGVGRTVVRGALARTDDAADRGLLRMKADDLTGDVVERASLADADELADLRVDYLEEDCGRLENEERSDYHLRTIAYLERHLGRDLTILVVRDKGIAGCAWMLETEKPPGPSFHNGHTASVLNVYVRPAQRRQGVGRRIMEALVEEARARNVSRIELRATTMGEGLYRSLGFAEDSTHRTMLRAL